MNMEYMKAALSDEAFVKSLFELETAAEVQSALKEKGVELSEEEILSIRELLLKVESGEISVRQLENGELSEEMLEQVAGGSMIALGIFTAVVVGVAGAALSGGIIHGVTGHYW